MASVPSPAVARLPEAPREIRIISHSSLFYWWPVWAVGLLMGLVSYFSPTRMAIVPSGSVARENVTVSGVQGERDAIILPDRSAKGHRPWFDHDAAGNPVDPRLHVGQSKNLGVLFCVILLLVIMITNVALRGLWSVIVIMLILSVSIIFALLDWWEPILERLGFLDIRVNAAGYMLVSGVLFVLWAMVTFLFDKQIYMVFTPGQLRVRLEIGDAETAYDTSGMTIQKQRSDLFRHWILGFGSGDLIVRTSGAQAHTFDMPNVLFLGRRVREIEDMLRSRPVVASQA
jgi:hypothetical protein